MWLIINNLFFKGLLKGEESKRKTTFFLLKFAAQIQ